MPNITVKLPSFESVAAGSTATVRCPIGATYRQILFTLGFGLEHLKELRVMGNGKAIMRFPTIGALSGGQVLDKLNQFEGRAASAGGLLVLDFLRYGSRTRKGEEETGLGTGYLPSMPGYQEKGGQGVELSTLVVEVDIDAAAVNPTISAKAIQSPKRPLGMIKKVRHFSFSASGAGEFDIADLPRSGHINKLSIFSDKVDALKIKMDQNTRFERTREENELMQVDGGRNPQAGVYVYDPTEGGNGSESLPMFGVQDFRLQLDMSAASNLPVMVEYLGYLEI